MESGLNRRVGEFYYLSRWVNILDIVELFEDTRNRLWEPPEEFNTPELLVLCADSAI
jgi:hypothetical protein